MVIHQRQVAQVQDVVGVAEFINLWRDVIWTSTFTQFEGFLGLPVFFCGKGAVVNVQVADNFRNVLLSACYIPRATQQIIEMVEPIRDAFLWTGCSYLAPDRFLLATDFVYDFPGFAQPALQPVYLCQTVSAAQARLRCTVHLRESARF